MRKEFSFDGVIWRICPHPIRPWVFIEERSLTLKVARFSGIDLMHGSCLLDREQFESEWYVGLLDVTDDKLILGQYSQEDPRYQSIVAYHFHSKQIQWWRRNFSIDAIGTEQVLGRDLTQDRKPIVLNLADGEISTEPFHGRGQENRVNYPEYYSELNDHYQTLKGFVRGKVSHEVRNDIEYLEYQCNAVISYYIAAGETLANYLLVVNEEGAVILHEKIAEQLKGVGVGTFFVVSGYLIFVKNRTVLVSVKVL